MKRRFASTAAALLAAFALAGCGGGPSDSECEKVLKHVIELEAAEAGGGAVPADQRADLEQRKKSVFQAIGISYCRDEMTAAQVECALAARTLSELSAKCRQS